MKTKGLLISILLTTVHHSWMSQGKEIPKNDSFYAASFSSYSPPSKHKDKESVLRFSTADSELKYTSQDSELKFFQRIQGLNLNWDDLLGESDHKM